MMDTQSAAPPSASGISPASGEIGQSLTSGLDLPDIIERARLLFDAGDVLLARKLASAGYDLAKTAGRISISGHFLDKARRLQGDALLIECRAKVRIADEYDAAQADGRALKGRRKKADESVPDGNTSFTLEEAGLDRKQIFDARKLRDAERREPGIAERAIAARLAQGLEPTRAAVRGIGMRSASADARGVDFYETPAAAIHALLCLERFAKHVWEPSCGHGAISGPLEAAGHAVLLSDLIDRGCATKDGEVQHALDFLKSQSSFISDNGFSSCDIVSNPPFGLVNDYIHHALTAHRPRKMALLLNLNMMCGADSAMRNFWMETWPPARILVFSRRLPMMHRDGYDGPVSGSQMNCAWFIWERSRKASQEQCQGTSASLHLANEINTPKCAWTEVYGTRTLMKRVDWKKLEDAEALPPLGSVPASYPEPPQGGEGTQT